MTMVAFLRGINLGKRQIKMEALRAAMTACGYANVRTLIASGNVLFEPPPNDGDEPQRLEACLQGAFGFPIDVILRSDEQIKTLVSVNPFAGAGAPEGTRLYVSFLDNVPEWDRPLPYDFPGGARLVHLAGGDVCTLLAPGLQTTDSMSVLEKEFGKRITTRNWNTVEKIAQALGG